MTQLLTGFRDHLIAQGLVRKPSVPGAHPPMWSEPKLGVPAPGEKQGTEDDASRVLGVFYSSGVAPRAYESGYRSDYVDVYFRSKEPTDLAGTFDLARAIRLTIGDKRQWSMGGFLVLESLEWRALQRISSDEQGYMHSMAFAIYHTES